MQPTPQVLGLKRSFGFGDRLGLATPGHIDAVKTSRFTPIFAQQSIRELARTQRQPDEVMRAASAAIAKAGWAKPWGADADHLQTREDVIRMANAGFTMFTIDPSAHVNRDADSLQSDALNDAAVALAKRGTSAQAVFDLYLNKSFDLGNGINVAFTDRVELLRAFVKYGGAVAHAVDMAGWIREACGSAPFELEMSVDETAHPTSPEEHLFIGLELKRRGVKVVSLAPRFVGDFEKGVDYKGDLTRFEEHYRKHVAIARHCGPYKLSIHSGSDKFSIYPVIGRLSGEHLHVKTAGTSYLEALRVICRIDRALFREFIAFCRTRYETDKASYHVSAALKDVPERVADVDLERWYLENDAGRQILHVTFGALLTLGQRPDKQSFKDALLENLGRNAELYREVLSTHLGKHLKLLGG